MKKLLLQIETANDMFYDQNGDTFWTSTYQLQCSTCESEYSNYFTNNHTQRYCKNCVTILTPKELFAAQLAVIKRDERLAVSKQKEKQLNDAADARELEAKAQQFYTAFMDYHKQVNFYLKPAWDDAINCDKEHFYYMAKYIISEEKTDDEGCM